MKAGVRSLGDLLSLMAEVSWSVNHSNETFNANDLMAKLEKSMNNARATFNKISSALDESRLEISYSYFDRKYYESFTVTIRRLLRHLTSIGSSCKQLLEFNAVDSINKESFKIFMREIESDFMQFVDLAMLDLRHVYNRLRTKESEEDTNVLSPWDYDVFGRERSNRFKDAAKKISHINIFTKQKSSDRKSKRLDALFPQIWKRKTEDQARASLLSATSQVRTDSIIEDNNEKGKETTFWGKFNDIFAHRKTSISSVGLSPTNTVSFKTINEAIEQLKMRQKQVVKDYLMQTNNDQMEETDVTVEDDIGTLVEGLSKSKTNGLIEELYCIFSFLLCLTMFGEKLDILSKKTRMMKKAKSLYVPFLWNDPQVRRSFSSINLLNRNEEDESGSIKSFDEPDSSRRASMNSLLSLTDIKLRFREFMERPRFSNFEIMLKSFKLIVLDLGYRLSVKFATPEYKYALRTAISVTLISLFGFDDDTYHFFYDWKGSWALFTVYVVMSPTIGASLSMGIWRIWGTLAGAISALLIWILIPGIKAEMGILQILCSIVVVWPLTFMRLYTKYSRIGIVALTTFSLILYGKVLDTIIHENNPQSNVSDIYQLALRRSVMIIVGVIACLLMSLVLFPYFAKVAARNELGKITQKLSLLFSKIVCVMTCQNDVELKVTTQDFLSLEFQIQNSIIKCQELLQYSSNEVTFDGHPFRGSLYKSLCQNSQNILDRLLSSRIAASQGFSDHFKKNVLLKLSKERRLFLGAVTLYFNVLHGTLLTREPMPPFLPDIEKSRHKVRKNLQAIPDVFITMMDLNDYHYLFISASFKEMFHDLDQMRICLQDLYGVRDDYLKLI
ncbi:hypothetical protein ROZALSC1DRAFT_24632, partial [Rozella allomycis CSF55]